MFGKFEEKLFFSKHCFPWRALEEEVILLLLLQVLDGEELILNDRMNSGFLIKVFLSFLFLLLCGNNSGPPRS